MVWSIEREVQHRYSIDSAQIQRRYSAHGRAPVIQLHIRGVVDLRNGFRLRVLTHRKKESSHDGSGIHTI